MIKTDKKDGGFDAFLSIHLSVTTSKDDLFVDIKLQREDLSTARLIEIVRKTIEVFEKEWAKNFSKIQWIFECIPTWKISKVSFKRSWSDIRSQLLKTVNKLY